MTMPSSTTASATRPADIPGESAATAADSRIAPPVTTPIPTSRPHISVLDGVRGLAALYVVLHHAVTEVYEGRLHDMHGLTLLLTAPFAYGHFAVCLFIVLSGFCLMLPVARSGELILRGGAKRFYWRRAQRILPTYYAALGLSLLLIYTLVGQKTGTHWDGSTVVTKEGIWTRLLMLQDIWELGGQINHVFWSVAIEWKIYFLFPLILWLGARFKLPIVSMVVGVVALALDFALLPTWAYGLRPHFFTMFLLGVCAAQASFSPDPKTSAIGRWRGWGPVAFVFLLLVLALNFLWRRAYVEAQWVVMDMVAGIGSAVWLMALVQQPASLMTKLLSWKPIVSLGLFGYSIYLIHGPLLQVVWQYLLHPLHLSDNATLVLLYTVGTALILLACYGFYLICEKPFIGRRLPAWLLRQESAS